MQAACELVLRHVVVFATLNLGLLRVPDELKRQSLPDGKGGQYSTNLDRNRYGEDNQYLATVIRYNLEYLGLCPCLITVDILDAKTGSTTKSVSAGASSCACLRQHVCCPFWQLCPFHSDSMQRFCLQPWKPPGGATLFWYRCTPDLYTATCHMRADAGQQQRCF